MDREHRLSGGHTADVVVRVGDTVRRAAGANSEFVARLLTHLDEVEAHIAPRFLGRDDQGRDVFEFIPGHTTDHPSQRHEAAYGAGGRMLRRLHEATASHELADGGECVIHGDPGPYNAIFRDGLPTTLIDWDSARPGNSMWDLGYMSWTWCIQSEGHVPLKDQVRRLRELRDGYGSREAEALLAQIEECQTFIITTSQVQLDRPGLPSHRYAHHRRAVAWAESDRRLLRQHRRDFTSALG